MKEKKSASKEIRVLQALPRSRQAINAFDCLTLYEGSAVDETWLLAMEVISPFPYSCRGEELQCLSYLVVMARLALL